MCDWVIRSGWSAALNKTHRLRRKNIYYKHSKFLWCCIKCYHYQYFIIMVPDSYVLAIQIKLNPRGKSDWEHELIFGGTRDRMFVAWFSSFVIWCSSYNACTIDWYKRCNRTILVFRSRSNFIFNCRHRLTYYMPIIAIFIVETKTNNSSEV